MSRNEDGFFSKVLGFFRIMIASALGFFLFFFGVMMIFVIVAAVSASEDEPAEIKAHSVLKLDFKGEIKERTPDDPFSDFGIPQLSQGRALGLIDIKKVLKNAVADPNIDGIYLNMSTFSAGFATLFELQKALAEFKASGKFIIAYGEYIDEKTFLLGATATKLYLNPQGMLEFNGLTTERFYFTRLFEKIGVKPKIFKVGDFKSAVEPYMLERMSEADRKQTTSYLNSIYQHYLENLAKARKINQDSLKTYSDLMSVRSAEDAQALRLVDDLFYYDQVLAELRKLTGAMDTEKFPFVKLNEYFAKMTEPISYGKDEIAVIVAEGDIVSGKGQADEIGSDTFAEAIRKARTDKKVKAIVLRINSRGGSALASDVMWREVQLALKEKPIIASMGEVAASGGYYMAMACQKIYAQPTTITGSIGIFGVLFEATELLEDKIGITFDRVNTGKLSALGMPTKKYSPEEELFFNKMIAEGYENFTSKAAEGRKMPIDTLKKYASGRVWTGLQAKENGLIDELGGLEDAIAEAVKAAKLTDYAVKYYPKQRNIFEELQEEGFEFMRKKLYEDEIGDEMRNYLKEYERIKKYQGMPQALMPHRIDFK